MKKLLTMLGSIGLVATASAGVVACGTSQKENTIDTTISISKDDDITAIASKLDSELNNKTNYWKINSNQARDIFSVNADGSWDTTGTSHGFRAENIATGVLLGIYKLGDKYQIASANNLLVPDTNQKVEVSFITLGQYIDFLSAHSGEKVTDYNSNDWVKPDLNSEQKVVGLSWSDKINEVFPVFDSTNSNDKEKLFNSGSHKVNVQIKVASTDENQKY